MNTKKKKKKGDQKDKPLPLTSKATKAQEYSKKNSKNNWSNNKSVYTRPRWKSPRSGAIKISPRSDAKKKAVTPVTAWYSTLLLLDLKNPWLQVRTL